MEDKRTNLRGKMGEEKKNVNFFASLLNEGV